jgi:hypothetical protein
LTKQEKRKGKSRGTGSRVCEGPRSKTATAKLTPMSSTPTHSEATKACSLMVCRTSENLILVVRVCPW